MQTGTEPVFMNGCQRAGAPVADFSSPLRHDNQLPLSKPNGGPWT